MVSRVNARPRNRLRRHSCRPKSDLPRFAKIGPGLRYYSHYLGRWVSRDPIVENGGANLFAALRNDGINRHDVLGLWGTEDHHSLTSSAMLEVLVLLGLWPIDDCGEYLENEVKRWNDDQDSPAPTVIGSNLVDRKRHFMREGGQDYPAARLAYANEVETYKNAFSSALASASPGKANCAKAIEQVGRLSHTWQDFFSHGMRQDGATNPTNELSIYTSTPGALWKAWTGSPPITGDPDNTSLFAPSKYCAGHPCTGEAIPAFPMEQMLRYSAAQAHAKTHVGPMIEEWYSKCRCCCPPRRRWWWPF